MKILFISDIHFNNGWSNAELVELLTLLRKHATQVHALVSLGDEIDTPIAISAVPSLTEKMLRRYLKAIAKAEFALVVGGTATHVGGYMRVFKQDGVKYSYESIESFKHNGVNFITIPEMYHLSREECLEKANDLKVEDMTNIIVGHGTVQGFFRSHDYEGKFPSAPEFSYKDFAPYNRAFFGHYHQHASKGNFTYVGSVRSNNASEVGDKGFIIYDTETNEIERINLTKSIKRIKLDLRNKPYSEIAKIVKACPEGTKYQVELNSDQKSAIRLVTEENCSLKLQDTTEDDELEQKTYNLSDQQEVIKDRLEEVSSYDEYLFKTIMKEVTK